VASAARSLAIDLKRLCRSIAKELAAEATLKMLGQIYLCNLKQQESVNEFSGV
jgi:hypothetical protein